MKTLGTAIFGWLVPGGAYLLARRYVQFGLSLALVLGAAAAGMALQGANLWPRPDELQGLDGFAAALAQVGALARMLAGVPYFLLRLVDPRTFLSGQTHEYGSILLALAGLFNLLALADALQWRKAKP